MSRLKQRAVYLVEQDRRMVPDSCWRDLIVRLMRNWSGK